MIDLLCHLASNDHGEWAAIALCVCDVFPWLRVYLPMKRVPVPVVRS